METVPLATIPWHYLGVVQCLAAGTTVVANGTNETERNLHEDLLLLDPEQTKVALKATQDPANSPTGLLAHVFAIANEAGKTQRYSWSAAGWPTTVPILLRASAPEFFLSPSGLVAPWPWPQVTPDDLAAKRAAAFGTASDSINQAFSPSPTGLYLNAFMRAADDAVVVEACRTELSDIKDSDRKVKDWIVNRAKNYGPSRDYPAGLVVHVEESRLTTATTWEIYASHLRLVLGWTRPAEKGAESFAFDYWPCGAFTGM